MTTKKRRNARLSGMNEICAYVRRSAATVLQWHHERGFPMKKVSGHQWISDTRKIDEWQKKQKLIEAGKKPLTPKNGKKKRARLAA